MDESTATQALAIGLRNSIQRVWPNLDPDVLYDVVHDGLLANWSEFVDAASLTYVQKEIYLQLKNRFESSPAS